MATVETATELGQLVYRALWLGDTGADLDVVEPLLAATERLVVGSYGHRVTAFTRNTARLPAETGAVSWKVANVLDAADVARPIPTPGWARSSDGRARSGCLSGRSDAIDQSCRHKLRPGDVVLAPLGIELRVDGGPDGGAAWVVSLTGLEATMSDGSHCRPPWTI